MQATQEKIHRGTISHLPPRSSWASHLAMISPAHSVWGSHTLSSSKRCTHGLTTGQPGHLMRAKEHRSTTTTTSQDHECVPLSWDGRYVVYSYSWDSATKVHHIPVFNFTGDNQVGHNSPLLSQSFDGYFYQSSLQCQNIKRCDMVQWIGKSTHQRNWLDIRENCVSYWLSLYCVLLYEDTLHWFLHDLNRNLTLFLPVQCVCCVWSPFTQRDM